MLVIDCEYGGSITLSSAEVGYRLRIYSEGKTTSVVLTTEEARALQQRIAAMLPEEEAE
jgi:hypothetical protein